MTPSDAIETVDLAILGGGLSGLSIAVALAEGGTNCPSTVILEARETYTRDRTWSYWRVHGHAFDAAARTRWTSCLVRHGNWNIPIETGDTPYETIDADALYALAQDRLAGHPKIALRLGAPAVSVEDGADGVLIETPQGRLRARLCIDTRPPAWTDGEGKPLLREGLVQAFAGIEVETETPCFDPGQAVLMDLVPGTYAGEMRFIYVLPYTQTRALVEDTRFTPVTRIAPPLEELEKTIETYVGAPFTVHYREAACLPMIPDLGLGAWKTGQRVLRAGTAGGALRPSSGYGFLAIQRQAARIGDAILSKGLAPDAVRASFLPRPDWLTYLDRIFLAVLRRHPDLAPTLFARMFAKARTDRLIRFLADTGSPADVFSVVSSMPKPPFLAEAAGLAMGRPVAQIGPAQIGSGS